MPYLIRSFRLADVPGIAEVINSASSYYQTEDGTSEQELGHHLTRPGLDPFRDVIVAEEEGNIIGAAGMHHFVSDADDSFRSWVQVHPDSSAQGLEDDLLNHLYALAQSRLGECRSGKVAFFTAAYSTERELVAAIKRAGLVQVRRGWVMVRDALESIPRAKFPDGIVTRPYRVGDDDRALHQADTEIFRDHWGHVDEPLEDWQHKVSRPSFKAELSIVAQDAATDQVAGFCTIEINDQENARLDARRGWIEVLGVRRQYRRRGLGTALVLAGLQRLRDAGVDHAALGCDAENQTGATRIYERVGFHVHRERIIFCKQVVPSRRPS